MKPLLDTNLLLDVLLRRDPFFAEGSRIWALSERREIAAVVSAISFNNVFYILRCALGREAALKAVAEMAAIFQIAPVDAEVIRLAVHSPIGDFEDAIQVASGLCAGADVVITRDESHFRNSTIPSLSPNAFLERFRSARLE